MEIKRQEEIRIQQQQEEFRRQEEYRKQQEEIQRQNAWAAYQQQQMMAQQQYYMTTTTYQQPIIPITTTTTYVQPQPQVTVTKTIQTETKHSKFPIHRLVVTVVRCRRLSKKDAFSKSDPYVVLMHNNTRFKTTYIKNTQNPVFNQDFEFRGVLEHDEIVINVFDKDTFGKDEFLGEVRVNKNDFVNNAESWYPLQSRQGRYDRVHGDILLRFMLHYS